MLNYETSKPVNGEFTGQENHNELINFMFDIIAAEFNKEVDKYNEVTLIAWLANLVHSYNLFTLGIDSTIVSIRTSVFYPNGDSNADSGSNYGTDYSVREFLYSMALRIQLVLNKSQIDYLLSSISRAYSVFYQSDQPLRNKYPENMISPEIIAESLDIDHYRLSTLLKSEKWLLVVFIIPLILDRTKVYNTVMDITPKENDEE